MSDAPDLPPVFNVGDYGEISDDSAANARALRSAVAAARHAGSGLVVLPAGEYALDDPHFTTGANITLQLEGNVHLSGGPPQAPPR